MVTLSTNILRLEDCVRHFKPVYCGGAYTACSIGCPGFFSNRGWYEAASKEILSDVRWSVDWVDWV